MSTHPPASDLDGQVQGLVEPPQQPPGRAVSDAAPQPSIIRRLIPGLGWRTMLLLAGVVGGVVGTAAAARVLNHDDFATYLIALSAFIITPLVAMLGLSRNAVRHIAKLNATDRHDEAMAYSRSVLGKAALITPVTCLVAAALVLIVRPSDPWAVVGLLWISLVLETLRLALGDVLLGHERQAWSALATYQPRVVGTAVVLGAFAVANVSMTLTEVLLVVLAIQLALAVACLVPLRTYLRVAPDPNLSFKDLMGDGLPFLGFDIGNFVLGRVDIWIAAAVLATSSDRASYGAAATLATQIVLPMSVPMLVASPIVRSLWVERRTVELTNLVRAVASLATGIAFVGFGALAVFGSTVLRVVYGGDFAEASGWLAILMIGSFVAVYTGASGTVHVLCVGPRQACVVSLLWAVVGATSMWAGAQLGGGTGLAICSTATLAGLNITQVVLVWRQAGINTLPTLRPGPAIRSLRGQREALSAA